MRRLALTALFFVLPSCFDEPDTPGTSSARLDTVDGTPRVTYAMDEVDRLEWRLDTLHTLGEAFGNDDRYEFDGVPPDHGLAGAPDGSLLVVDGAAGRVLRYDHRGVFVRQYGREGRGPGELTAPQAVNVVRDTVWVLETNARRITGFPLGVRTTPVCSPSRAISFRSPRFGCWADPRTGSRWTESRGRDRLDRASWCRSSWCPRDPVRRRGLRAPTTTDPDGFRFSAWPKTDPF